MPAPLASSANTATPAASNSAARTPRSEGGKDFSQLLQGGAPRHPRCWRRHDADADAIHTQPAIDRRQPWPGTGRTQRRRRSGNR